MNTAQGASRSRTVARIRYAVCSTPFGGGAELCALLRDSGRAGTPSTCFDPQEHTRASARLPARDLDSYVAHLESTGAGEGGVFGFEIHWPHYVSFFAARDPREAFPGVKAILVRRRDRLAQALCWALAEAEQRERGAPAFDLARLRQLLARRERGPPGFDPARVRQLLARIAEEEDAWRGLFRGTELPVLELTREDVVESPEVELRHVLRWLGSDASELRRCVAPDPEAVHAARLAEWRGRYAEFEERERAAVRSSRHAERRSATDDRSASRVYGYELRAHNLPARIPAQWVHGARGTLVNTGNFTWHSHALGRDGFERGDIALVVREDGERAATHALPRREVHPGEEVTFHFALVAPARPGKRRLTFELIEWDVAPFEERGAKPLELWIEVQRPSTRKTAAVQRSARRVNPWHLAPAGGVIEGSEGHLYPGYLVRAQGCRISDLEGKEYLDYGMAGGSALLGHADARVLAAIREVMESVGPATRLPHPLEVEVARMLCEDFPCAEMVAFARDGSDARALATRLARAFTGKRHVLQRVSHDSDDSSAELPGSTIEGALPVHPFRYGDRAGFLRLCERFQDDLAAVLVEPAAWLGDRRGHAVDAPEFLAFVAEAARDAGALFLLDENTTAFRHPHGSVQKATGIVPDLACVSKALASGMPLAAVIGRADVMRRSMGALSRAAPPFRAEACTLAAARATLEVCRKEPVAARVNDHGRRLKAGLEELCCRLDVPVRCVGPDFCPSLVFLEDDPHRLRLQRTLLVQELLRGGVLTDVGTMVPSHAHDEDALARALEVAGAALETISRARSRGDLEQRIEIPPVDG